MKKILSSLLLLCLLTGCSNTLKTTDEDSFIIEHEISVVSREDGSGTRGAFIEIFKVEVKDANGNKKDQTTDEAIIAKATDILLSTIVNDKYSIGYVSMGSLNDNVKGLSIDEVKPTIENVNNGSYSVSRPFHIAYKDNLSDVGLDFLNFILSEGGQNIVENQGYIKVEANDSFISNMAKGKIVIGGSSSISPLMEKIQEAYLRINHNAIIEINTSDSSTGLNETKAGVCDIGMASRELKDGEKADLLYSVIAQDGIVVIVNKDNPIDSLTKTQVRMIFSGEVLTWDLV